MTELEQLEAALYLIENQQSDQPNLARNCALREIYKAARAYAEAMKQKPFAYLYPYGMGEKELFSYQKLDLSGEKPLYAAPPVTQDAAREPLKLPCVRGGYTCFNDGWNACIEETKRLNGVM